MTRGRLITLEGGEGAGKSTQVQRILQQLAAAGIAAQATREPGGSPDAEALRTVLLSGRYASLGPAAEALLFAAARIDHIDTTIAPALAAGRWVVCDRFIDSTRAYQGALGGVPYELLEGLDRVALGGLQPDLTLMLDLPAEIGLRRAAMRRRPDTEPDRFERESLAAHQHLRAAFLDIAARNPGRCVVVDATQSPDEVAAAIAEAIDARLLRHMGETIR
jgi:dTMP kinase